MASVTTPLDYYQSQCERGVITDDHNQSVILQSIQPIYDALLTEQKRRFSSLSIFRCKQPIKGLYLWGSVGIGKTFIMDCFYQSLPFAQKKRLHFHEFMKSMHFALLRHQGEADPLKRIAKELAKSTLVLCLDEFLISDIADAMILGELLKALFSEGICFVTTSNTEPDLLYRYGLQRLYFLPAIALLKEKTHVMHAAGAVDYRLGFLKAVGVFFYSPHSYARHAHLVKTFDFLSKERAVTTEPIDINGRSIAIKSATHDMVWFDFDVICRVPRSQQDYLALAERVSVIMVSDMPQMADLDRDSICLFVSFIDVLYDQRIRLIMSLTAPLSECCVSGYKGLGYAKNAERTYSRLLEMQSNDYQTRLKQ